MTTRDVVPGGSGLRGLPGVNAIPADDFIADRVADPDSMTNEALGEFVGDEINDYDIGLRAAVANTYAPVGNQTAFRGVIQKANLGVEPVAIGNLGDSTSGTITGASVYEYFFYKAMYWLAAKFAVYTALLLTWDDTYQSYLSPVRLQTGTAGDRRIRVTSTATVLSTPDSVKLSIGGDFSVRLKAAVKWVGLVTQSTLAGKMEGAGQRSWKLDLTTAGKLLFTRYVDGTTAIDHLSSIALPFSNYDVRYVRADVDQDNGAGGTTVTFYYSTDKVTWTQLGTPIANNASTGATFDSTASLYLGGRTGGGWADAGAAYADFYELELIATNDVPVALFDLDVLPQIGTTMTDFSGNAWTLSVPGSANESRIGAPCFVLFNGGRSGETISYSNDSTRFAKQTPYPVDVMFINYSENEATNISYRAAYKQLADAVVAKFPDANIVATLQPKRLSPAANITEHDIRTGQIAALAASQRYGVVDVRGAFGTTPANYTKVDGIHPTFVSDKPVGVALSGGEKWAEEIKDRHLRPHLRALGINAA